MPDKTQAQHHFHVRKRIHQNLEPYPHPQKFKWYIDHLIYVVGVLGPIFTLPQVKLIWIDQTASGVSPVSWSAYFLGHSIWIMYGIVHKEKPIYLINGAMVVLDVLIISGVFLYG